MQSDQAITQTAIGHMSLMKGSMFSQDFQAETFAVEELKEGGSYEFRVAAFSEVGMSGWSQSEPIAAVSMFSIPEQPRNVKIEEVNRFEVILIWREPVFDGGARITHYNVEKREKLGQRWTNVGKTETLDCKFRVSVKY